MIIRALVAVLCVIALGQPAFAKRLALVIGNDDYLHLPKLERAVADAREIRAAFERLGFSVTHAENVDFAAFATTLAAFAAQVEPGDEVAFHFSGHGVAIAGRNFLLPTDMVVPTIGQESLVRAFGRDAGQLVGEIAARGTRLVFALLDACRDNPFDTVGRSIGAPRGLARMTPEVGEFVLFAAGPGERALDRLGDADTAKTSIFTRVLLQHLETPGLSLQDIAKATQGEVRRLAATVGHAQFPDYFDRTEGKPVLKAMQSASRPPPDAPAGPPADIGYRLAMRDGSDAALLGFVRSHPSDARAAEILDLLDRRDDDRAFKAAEDERSPDALRAYLDRHPKGRNVEQARERLGLLERRLFALTIGINKYDLNNHAEDLRGAVNDAEDIDKTLSALGFRVKRLIDYDASGAALEREWSALVDSATENDLIVLHYSGHAYHNDIGESGATSIIFGRYSPDDNGKTKFISYLDFSRLIEFAIYKKANVLIIADTNFGFHLFRPQSPDADSFITAMTTATGHNASEVEVDGKTRGVMSWAFARALENVARTGQVVSTARLAKEIDEQLKRKEFAGKNLKLHQAPNRDKPLFQLRRTASR